MLIGDVLGLLRAFHSISIPIPSGKVRDPADFLPSHFSTAFSGINHLSEKDANPSAALLGIRFPATNVQGSL
jgi:hypothetical protein